MRLLLDSHAFAWWRDSPEKLSKAAHEAIADPDNEIFLSTVSVWEMQIKKTLGKFELARPLAEVIDAERNANGLQILSLSLQHIYKLDDLPHPSDHKDPFDRALIAQAMFEDLVIVTADGRFADYKVNVLW